MNHARSGTERGGHAPILCSVNLVAIFIELRYDTIEYIFTCTLGRQLVLERMMSLAASKSNEFGYVRSVN